MTLYHAKTSLPVGRDSVHAVARITTMKTCVHTRSSPTRSHGKSTGNALLQETFYRGRKSILPSALRQAELVGLLEGQRLDLPADYGHRDYRGG